MNYTPLDVELLASKNSIYYSSKNEIRPIYNISSGKIVVVIDENLTQEEKDAAHTAISIWESHVGDIFDIDETEENSVSYFESKTSFSAEDIISRNYQSHILFSSEGTNGNGSFSYRTPNQGESYPYYTRGVIRTNYTYEFYELEKWGWGYWTEQQLISTYLHELGHALGLGHNTYNDSTSYSASTDALWQDTEELSVMSYFRPYSSTVFFPHPAENENVEGMYGIALTPMMSDIRAYELIHGLTLIHNPGDTTYEYSKYSDISAFYTIYDSDGNDTLDRKDAGFSETINLNPGHESLISTQNGIRSKLWISLNTKIENIHLGSGNDTVHGTTSQETIYGNNGNDSIMASVGKDVLYGGAGNDIINGQGSNDYIEGNNGFDIIWGGTGNDSIYGNNNEDYLYGEDGEDTIYGNLGDDMIYAGNGNDSILGNEDNDIVYADSGNDTVYGGSGFDNVEGMVGNDLLFGDNGTDIIRGGLWADTIYGGNENDQIYGDESNDFLYGGIGQDTIYGGTGNDRMFGGITDHSRDLFIFIPGQGGNDTIEDFHYYGSDIIHKDSLLIDGRFVDESFSVHYSGDGQKTIVTISMENSIETITIIGLPHLVYPAGGAPVQIWY